MQADWKTGRQTDGHAKRKHFLLFFPIWGSVPQRETNFSSGDHQVTLKEFMAELNSIVETKFEEDRTDTWYSYRGVEILKDGVGITGYTSVDESTRQVLQQIIKETTDRINRREKQTSDDEVRLHFSFFRGDRPSDHLHPSQYLVRIAKSNFLKSKIVDSYSRIFEHFDINRFLKNQFVRIVLIPMQCI